MRADVFRQFRFRAEIWLDHHGWLPVVVAAFCAGAALIQWAWIAPQRARQAELQSRLAKPVRASLAPPPAEAVDELARVLPPPDALHALTEALFVAAQAQGLKLERSSFQYEREPVLAWRRVAVSLPLKGDYPSVRRFVETVLRDHPHVALEQLGFKVEGSGTTQPEVVVSLSAWFRTGEGRAPAPAMEPVR